MANPLINSGDAVLVVYAHSTTYYMCHGNNKPKLKLAFLLFGVGLQPYSPYHIVFL